MIQLLGLVMILAAIPVGIYVGGYVCFWGGLVDIINGIKDGWIATVIAWGIVKVVFAGVCGVAAVAFLALPGLAFIKSR